MNTTFYAEYRSSGMCSTLSLDSLAHSLQMFHHDTRAGPGGNSADRVPIEHLLTDEEAKEFTIEKVFLGKPKWIDYDYLV